MLELTDLGVNIDVLKKDINNLKLNEEVELKELYSKWNELDNNIRLKIGKVFYKLVLQGDIKSLLFIKKKTNNHAVYQKVV